MFENCTAVEGRFDRVGADELTALRHVPFPDPEVERVQARRLPAFLRLRSDCPEREDDADPPDHELLLRKCVNLSRARQGTRCSDCESQRPTGMSMKLPPSNSMVKGSPASALVSSLTSLPVP